MKFNHKKRAFNESIGMSKKEMDNLVNEALSIVKMIESKKERRSLLLEKIVKKLNKYSKDQIYVILFIALEMTNEGKYYLLGEVMESMFLSAMVELKRYGINIGQPPRERICEDCEDCDDMDDDEIDDEVIDFCEELFDGKKKQKKKGKHDARFDYVG